MSIVRPVCGAPRWDGQPCQAWPALGLPTCKQHSDTPDRRPRCGAMKGGRPCQNFPLKNSTRCRLHGGATPTAVAKAKRIVEQERAEKVARKYVTRSDVHPVQALLDLVAWTAGEVDYWRGRVAELRDDELVGMMVVKEVEGVERGDSTDVRESAVTMHVAVKMLNDSSERLARYAAAALKAGVDERRVQIIEQQGVMLAVAIRRILERLELTKDQETLVGVVVPEELRQLVAVTA